MTREAALIERTPEEALSDWDHEAWRASVGDDLLGGYAVLAHPPRGDQNRHSVSEITLTTLSPTRTMNKPVL